jgi:hypothetical protein
MSPRLAPEQRHTNRQVHVHQRLVHALLTLVLAAARML